MGRRTFTAILIKPSHYDDDGYVIQWWRSTIPSNSLASVYGLLRSARASACWVPTSTSTIEAYDECNTVIDVKRRDPAHHAGRRRDGRAGRRAVEPVSPRARPRRQFRAAGSPVVIGGFHVSGCISMLPELPPDLQEARRLGIILFAGEAEGRMAGAAARHRRRAAAADLQLPARPARTWRRRRTRFCRASIVTRVAGHYASFDAGRGCPFQCSFCTIINVQGRKSRYRTPTTSRRSCAPMPRRASRASSSPTTISPATAIGSRSSTA